MSELEMLKTDKQNWDCIVCGRCCNTGFRAVQHAKMAAWRKGLCKVCTWHIWM